MRVARDWHADRVADLGHELARDARSSTQMRRVDVIEHGFAIVEMARGEAPERAIVGIARDDRSAALEHVGDHVALHWLVALVEHAPHAARSVVVAAQPRIDDEAKIGLFVAPHTDRIGGQTTLHLR